MAIREGLLVLLVDGEQHGYQLKREFERRTGGVWPLNVGQVYTTLDRLERDGFVAPREADAEGRKAYALTEQGRTAAADWLFGPALEPAATRDELTLRVLLAVNTPDIDPIDVTQAERMARLSQLQAHRRRQRGIEVDDLESQLALDALVTRVEGELRWLDLVDERLRTRPVPTTTRTSPAVPPAPAKEGTK